MTPYTSTAIKEKKNPEFGTMSQMGLPVCEY